MSWIPLFVKIMVTALNQSVEWVDIKIKKHRIVNFYDNVMNLNAFIFFRLHMPLNDNLISFLFISRVCQSGNGNNCVYMAGVTSGNKHFTRLLSTVRLTRNNYFDISRLYPNDFRNRLFSLFYILIHINGINF